VRTLVNSYLTSGPRVMGWDGKDDAGRSLASGHLLPPLQGGGSYLNRTIISLS